MVRKAIIVGSAAGIGQAICTKLADDGFRIVAADRDLKGAERAISLLGDGGHGAREVDIAVEAEVEALFESVEHEGPADVLVTVAGGTLVDTQSIPTIADMSTMEWERTLSLNLSGTFYCLRKFAKLRRARPLAHMRIVTFSSLSGEIGGTPTGVAYVAAKAAVIGLTRQAAAELAADRITVNAIAPGPIRTPGLLNETSDESLAKLTEMVPLKRLGEASEVAAAVAFLVSPAAAFVTGTTLDVNGGIHMH